MNRSPHLITVTRIACAAALLLLGGCATTQTDESFATVSTGVEQDTGYLVHWYTGSQEDRQVQQSIDRWLEDELTLDQAVQIALLNNRGLQATYQDLGLAQADLVQAGLLSNPVFSGKLLFPLEGGGTEIELGVAQNFLELLTLPMRKRIARTEFEEAKLRVTVAVYDLVYDAKLAYYQAQAQGQRVEMYEQIVLANELSYEYARRLHAAGNITELDLARQREQYESARLMLRQVEAERDRKREKLTRLMGLFGDQTQWSLAGRLAEVPDQTRDLANIERDAIANSIDLAIARQRILATGQRLGLNESTAWFDELELGVEGEYGGEWAVGPALSVPIPLFDRGQARVARSRYELRQQQERFTQMSIELRSLAREARVEHELAHDAAQHYRTVVLPLRQKIINETQLQFNAMQVGLYALLDAKQRQIEAGERYIQLLLKYWTAEATIDQLMLGRMPDMGAIEGADGMQNMAASDSAAAGH